MDWEKIEKKYNKLKENCDYWEKQLAEYGTPDSQENYYQAQAEFDDYCVAIVGEMIAEKWGEKNDSLKCTECGHEIVEMDCYDYSMYDDVVVTKHVGECLMCGKDFQWTEFYKRTEFSDPEPI